jgi:uncharacterized membrane protein
MKEVIKTIGEIFVRIDMFAMIFFITWTLTSFDIIGVLFISAVLFSMVFLPIILGAEKK